MKLSILKRLISVYLTLGRTFGTWFAPIISGILIGLLRIIIFIGMKLDFLFFPSLNKKQIKNPIVIIGNPRSGTTFLHRFLVNENVAFGSELWQLLYPSLFIQKLVKPILPFLEKISPTRHHSTAAHKTSLQSIETDDASILFRYLDGFFLYGFILAWAETDLFHWFDPKVRDNSKRDFKWLSSLWNRISVLHGSNKIIAKLFSISVNTPRFQDKFPEAKILYMVRDPLNVIPSGLSLVTGVLDKKFGFWSLPKNKRIRYINRLYKALVELLARFHSDWKSGKIDKDKVMIVRFDRMMTNFDDMMDELLNFIGYKANDKLLNSIKETAESQKKYKSKHNYDLDKFGLTEEQIRRDCAFIYSTFLED